MQRDADGRLLVVADSSLLINFLVLDRKINIIPRMKPKIPWLPAEVQPGQKTEPCPRCGANKLFPWTLRREPQRFTVIRTWVCAACQLTEERPEPDDAAPSA